MKVLQIITKSEEGGAQTVCLQTMEGLQSKGVSFEAAFYPDGWLHSKCKDLGITVHPIRSMCKEISFRNDCRTFRRIRAIIREGDFDLVHCHSSKAGLLGRLAALSTGTPSIFTAHGWAFTVGARWPNRLVGVVSEFIAGKISSAIICVSEFDEMLGRKFKVASANKLTVIRNGACDITDELLATPGADGIVKIAMAARFSNQKDQDQLIRAAARLKGDFLIFFMGDGPLVNRCKSLAKECGLVDKVEFLGTRNDVPELLAGSHIGVLTSHYEGMPISLIEQLRAGLPVVASHVGGVAELIDDGENGYLIPPGDEELLASRLQELIDSSQKRMAMGKAGRVKFVNEFHIDRFLGCTFELYKCVVGPLKIDKFKPTKSHNPRLSPQTGKSGGAVLAANSHKGD